MTKEKSQVLVLKFPPLMSVPVCKASKAKGLWFLFAPNACSVDSHHLLFRPVNSARGIQAAFYTIFTIFQHLEPFTDNGISFVFLLSQAVYYMVHIPN
jgi:hypothetical protein